jgi:hypothetical protein
MDITISFLKAFGFFSYYHLSLFLHLRLNFLSFFSPTSFDSFSTLICYFYSFVFHLTFVGIFLYFYNKICSLSLSLFSPSRFYFINFIHRVYTSYGRLKMVFFSSSSIEWKYFFKIHSLKWRK